MGRLLFEGKVFTRRYIEIGKVMGPRAPKGGQRQAVRP